MLASQMIQTKYPTIRFRHDLAADLKLTVGQARRNKALNPHRGFQDLTVFAARGGWHGLCVELKKPGENIYATRTTKWGGYATEHLQEQAEHHTLLRKEKYCAEFAVGIDQFESLLEWYMDGCKGPLVLERSSDGKQRFTNTESGEIF